MAASWETKAPMFEYSFYECESGLATQWGPWGDTDTSGHDRPAAELHEHLCQAYGAERTSQITWHTNPAPRSRLGVKLSSESFSPRKHCQKPTHPLEELYPNHMPLLIGHKAVYLHVDKGLTTASSSDQQAHEHFQSGSLEDDQETSTDSALIEANLPAASSTNIDTNSEKPSNSQPKASWKKDKGKGRAIEQEQGEQEAQLGAATHATKSVVRPAMQTSKIGINRTGEGSTHQGSRTTALAAPAPSRKVAKSARHNNVEWTEDMKLCLWVMSKAFGTQLEDWTQRANVWNKVFKNQKVFKDGGHLSSSRVVSGNQLKAQLFEHRKTETEYAHQPAIQQWVAIKAMAKTDEKFETMEQEVRAAMAAPNTENV